MRGAEGQETAQCAQNCITIGNSTVCTELHNDRIYSLNENVLIILFSTDIAYGMFKVLTNNSIGLNYSGRTAQ